MITKYSSVVDNNIICKNLHRLIGQTYKLLPYREEGLDWEKPLITIQEELAGLSSLLLSNEDFQTNLLALECKLESLRIGQAREDFEIFRGTIFECIGRIKGLQDIICQDSVI